jgi:D-alanine-D-alanine ligase
VGISKAKTSDQLATAIDLAFEFDLKVVVEAAVPAAREIEVGVLGNDDVEASVAGEVVPDREFYDYEAKYLDSASTVLIPAALDETQHAEIRRLAIQAFQAVDGAGMARVDFLLSRETGTLYVNEVNTIPGFTTISMFSKLWAATGVDYPALLDRLIRLALERHAEKQRLKTSAL